MFADHQPMIAAHAATPDGFADVVTFVVCTIKQHLYRVGDIVANSATTGMLTRRQRGAVDYIRQHAATVRAACAATDNPIDRLRILVELPNIGIAKAGFITQLCYGQVGCLDRHNLRLVGLAEKTFQHIPTSAEALTARLQTYAAACAALGTPAQLWDGWCALIAARYPEHFVGPEDVSYKHVLWTNSVGCYPDGHQQKEYWKCTQLVSS